MLNSDYLACHLAAGVASAADIQDLKSKYDVYSVNADFLVALAFSKASPRIAKLGKHWRKGFFYRLYNEFWKGRREDSQRAVGLRPENYKGALTRSLFDEEMNKLPKSVAPAELRLLMQNRQSRRAVSQQIIEAISAIGITVRVELKEGEAFRKAHDTGDFDIVLQFVGASESDPDSAWRMYNSEMLEPVASAQDLANAQGERNSARREELYRALEIRAIAKATYVPLIQEHTYICVGPNVELDVENATEWGLAFSHLKRK